MRILPGILDQDGVEPERSPVEFQSESAIRIKIKRMRMRMRMRSMSMREFHLVDLTRSAGTDLLAAPEA
jgi:hypothetical protein